MRRRLAVLLALLAGCHAHASTTPPSSSSPSTTPAADEVVVARPGVHGMVLFGRDALYASHLPMYEAPHDVQAVLRLHPRVPTLLDAWRRELATQPIITFVPAPFDLSRLAGGGEIDLVGDIYLGHFERGGTVWTSGVEVRAEVVFFHVIPPDPPTTSDAIAFGHATETYVVPLIGPRPGVDRIIAVDAPAPAKPETITFDTLTLSRMGWTERRVLYEERADLR